MKRLFMLVIITVFLSVPISPSLSHAEMLYIWEDENGDMQISRTRPQWWQEKESIRPDKGTKPSGDGRQPQGAVQGESAHGTQTKGRPKAECKKEADSAIRYPSDTSRMSPRMISAARRRYEQRKKEYTMICMGSAPPGRGASHWIKEVMRDGKLIVLEDNSLWEVSAEDIAHSVQWPPNSSIDIREVIGHHPFVLMNTDDGEEVEVRYFGRR